MNQVGNLLTCQGRGHFDGTKTLCTVCGIRADCENESITNALEVPVPLLILKKPQVILDHVVRHLRECREHLKQNLLSSLHANEVQQLINVECVIDGKTISFEELLERIPQSGIGKTLAEIFADEELKDQMKKAEATVLAKIETEEMDEDVKRMLERQAHENDKWVAVGQQVYVDPDGNIVESGRERNLVTFRQIENIKRLVAVCMDNTGMQDKFSINGVYQFRDGSSDDMIFVIGQNGKETECLKERFRIEVIT